LIQLAMKLTTILQQAGMTSNLISPATCLATVDWQDRTA
jgi:hypothetical protein